MTDKTKYLITDEARISARVLDRSLKPSTEKSQEVIVEKPDGTTEKLDIAIAKFAATYADQTEADYQVFRRAAKSGRFPPAAHQAS